MRMGKESRNEEPAKERAEGIKDIDSDVGRERQERQIVERLGSERPSTHAKACGRLRKVFGRGIKLGAGETRGNESVKPTSLSFPLLFVLPVNLQGIFT